MRDSSLGWPPTNGRHCARGNGCILPVARRGRYPGPLASQSHQHPPEFRRVRPLGRRLLGPGLVACEPQGRPRPPQRTADAARARCRAAHHLPAGIDWFDGDVDAAFAAAKAADKPLFLYWGAEWCPPCAQIKATIFNQREFQERSRLFVPVYLDGDTPSAQKHGETLRRRGLPDDDPVPGRRHGDHAPAGRRGRRALRHDSRRRARATHARSRTAGDRATRRRRWSRRTTGDCSPTTPGAPTTAAPAGGAGTRGDSATRASAARSSCRATARDSSSTTWTPRPAAVEAGCEPRSRPRSAPSRAEKLLDAAALPCVQAANVENLLVRRRRTRSALLSDAGSPERGDLTTRWQGALDRLGAPRPSTTLSGAGTAEPAARARVACATRRAGRSIAGTRCSPRPAQAVARVDAETTDAYARQAADQCRGEPVLGGRARRRRESAADRGTAEVANRRTTSCSTSRTSRRRPAASRKPCSGSRGRTQGAEGPATRFQWGYNYLVGLLEMTPDDTQRIERAGSSVLGELDDSPDAFYQRTRMRLEQLDAKLLEWGQEGEAARGRRDAPCPHRRDLPQPARRRRRPAQLRALPQSLPLPATRSA